MKKKLNENGQLTLEFMFAIILITAVSTLLGILTFTLSLTEVLQYVTYAGARTYLAADFHVQDQQDVGNAKARQLLSSLPFLSGAEASGWIKAEAKGAKSYDAYRDSIGADPTFSQFDGFQLVMTVPMLNVRIPFIKDVITPPDGSQDFKSTLSSFLTREPAFEECQRYLGAAYSILLTRGDYSGASKNTGNSVVIMDNGC